MSNPNLKLYTHNETGKIYKFLAFGICATKSNDGANLAIYCPDDDGMAIYVRDLAEFYEKFTEYQCPA